MVSTTTDEPDRWVSNRPVPIADLTVAIDKECHRLAEDRLSYPLLPCYSAHSDYNWRSFAEGGLVS